MAEQYRVAIVGAGPAGIFAALELERAGVSEIVIVEKGPDLPERQRLGRGQSMLSGWGGAGAYSDGKLALSTEIGGNLARYSSPGQLMDLVSYVDETYRAFGAPDTVPAGNAALSTSNWSIPSASLPRTFETMCITCE